MMKKYSLIAALVIALTFAFVGCSGTLPGDDDDGDRTGSGELKEKVVFDLSNNAAIQALSGTLSFASNANPISPLVLAGDSTVVEAVDNGGKVSIKFTTAANWGAGIDLRFSAFGFREGDEIEVKGELITLGSGPSSGSPRLELNFKPGAENAFGTEKTAVGEFEQKVKLTATLLNDIKAASPQGVRISAYGTGAVVRIDSIIIKGMRPTEITKNEAPVLTASGNIVSWAAVAGAGGYKVYADGDQIATLPSTSTSYDMLSANIAEGKYSVEVVATGIDGETSDSDKSKAVDVTRQLPQLKITLGTAEVSVGVQPRGTGGKVETSGSTFTYTAGTDGYGWMYVVFDLKLPAEEKLSDYASVSFYYRALAGDAGSKNVRVLAGKTTELTGYLADALTDADDGSGTTSFRIANSAQLNAVAPNWASSTNLAIDNAGRLNDQTTVRIGFYIHGSQIGNLDEIGSATKFAITTIKFTK